MSSVTSVLIHVNEHVCSLRYLSSIIWFEIFTKKLEPAAPRRFAEAEMSNSPQVTFIGKTAKWTNQRAFVMQASRGPRISRYLSRINSHLYAHKP